MGFRRTKIGQQCRQKRVFYDRDSNMTVPVSFRKYSIDEIVFCRTKIVPKSFSVEQKSFRNVEQKYFRINIFLGCYEF